VLAGITGFVATLLAITQGGLVSRVGLGLFFACMTAAYVIASLKQEKENEQLSAAANALNLALHEETHRLIAAHSIPSKLELAQMLYALSAEILKFSVLPGPDRNDYWDQFRPRIIAICELLSREYAMAVPDDIADGQHGPSQYVPVALYLKSLADQLRGSDAS
jgi:hypothetical protein